MREADPVVSRNDLHQVPFDSVRRSLLRKLQPSGQAYHMRVYHHAIGDSVPRSKYDIGGLACDTRKTQDLVHRSWDLATKLFGHCPCRTLDRFRLVAEKSGGSNQFFNLRQRCVCHCLWRRKGTKQLRRDLVDARVRTLRGQDGRYRQLPRIAVIQSADCVWVSAFQYLDKGGDPLRCKRVAPASRTFTRLLLGHSALQLAGRHRSAYPRRSSISAGERRTQLKIGVSCRVYMLISVSRSCCTRSRKSSGKLVSNATTNSWSSIPKE